MSKPTVCRKDITLEENVERVDRFNFDHLEYSEVITWSATLYGALSTGEDVNMSRTAEHAGEALLLLTEAIEAEGWELK